MSGKVRIKKCARNALADKDVIENFQGLLGGGTPTHKSMMLIVPKYEKIKNQVERYIKTLSVLTGLRDMSTLERAYLIAYIETMRSFVGEIFNAPDVSQYLKPKGEGIESLIIDYSSMPADVLEEYGKIYNNCKKNVLITIVLKTCEGLVPYKSSIGNVENLTDNFIISSAMEMKLLNRSKNDFKTIFNDIINSESLEDEKQVQRNFVLMILNKLYTIGVDLNDLITTPDIDVDEFVTVLIDSIDGLKKKIPRCNEAFDKIRDSVGLLKNNFKSYYGDFAASGNPTIIMENFVMDVAKDSTVSPRVSGQFKEIIKHYKDMAGAQVQDPRVKNMLKHLDKNMKLLEKVSKKHDEDPEGECDISDDDSDCESDEEVRSAVEAFDKLAKSKISDDKVYN